MAFERFLEALKGHKRCNILYDPSHFVLQQLDYLDYLDIYHERIKAFHVKDAEFNPTGRQGVYSGYAPWVEGLPVQEAYDPQRDVAFYAASGVLVPVSAGMFAIFAPHEVHAPCLAPTEPEPAGEVLKVVVKCRWEM